MLKVYYIKEVRNIELKIICCQPPTFSKLNYKEIFELYQQITKKISLTYCSLS